LEPSKLSAKSPVFIGLFLIVLGILLLLLNFSVLPLIGAILGIPAIGAGIYFVYRGRKGSVRGR
jgi:uncharacterized membrane protein HdeD (DUF308 family)